MGKIVTVCIKCGTFKSGVPHRCPQCDFKPSDELDIAKSFILSESFDGGDRVFGRSKQELKRVSDLLKGGGKYEFDEEELRLVLEEYRAFSTLTPLVLVKDIARWLAGPALLLLLFAYVIWFSPG